jgi:RNA polymerase sigma-70 factor (ECF subfamily)
MGRVMGEDAFDAVVAQYHGEIHRYLARVTRRASDADDLSQETFLRAFRAHGSLPETANLRAWLFAIATNVYRNHVRSESRRRRAYAAAGSHATGEDREWPEARALADEAGAQVERVVGALPLRQRLAFTLRKIHELDYESIARSLGCSAEAARAHVFQATKKVRRALDESILTHTEPSP